MLLFRENGQNYSFINEESWKKYDTDTFSFSIKLKKDILLVIQCEVFMNER